MKGTAVSKVEPWAETTGRVARGVERPGSSSLLFPLPSSLSHASRVMRKETHDGDGLEEVGHGEGRTETGRR